MDRQLTARGAVMGSPHYMAPEQSTGGKPTERTDVYGLGCTLWYLLTGAPVFDGANEVETIYAHQKSPVPDPGRIRRDVPHPLRLVLERMLAKSPEDRPESMARTIELLEAAIRPTGCNSTLLPQAEQAAGSRLLGVSVPQPSAPALSAPAPSVPALSAPELSVRDVAEPRLGSGPAVGAPPVTAPAEPAAAERFGRYRIEKLLGEGGMGAVYLAYDTELDRRVALKVAHGSMSKTAGGAERFRREAKLLASLRHPNICPIYDFGERNDQPYLCMALIDGRTLQAALEKGPLPSRRAIELTILIARALEVAHRAGIIHRDLKPANIMLTPDGQPIVMDFGLARRAEAGSAGGDADLTRRGDILGSPAYMSPEQARGIGEDVGPASDVYGLGTVLFEMLTGRTPYTGDSWQMIMAHVRRPVPAVRELDATIDPRLEAICTKAMAKQREDRFPSARALADALEAMLREGAESPPAAGAPSLGAGHPQRAANEPSWRRPGPRGGGRSGMRGSSRAAIGIAAACGVGVLVLAVVSRPSGNLPEVAATSADRTASVPQRTAAAPAPTNVHTGTAPESTGHAPPVAPAPVGVAVPPVGAGILEVAAPESRIELPQDVRPDARPIPPGRAVDLEVHWQRAAERGAFRVLKPGIQVPKEGDRFHLHVRTVEPSFVYILWCDAAGKMSCVYPPEGAKPTRTTEVWEPPLSPDPLRQAWHKLGGPSGHELLVAAVSAEPLDAESLKRFCDRRWSILPEAEAVRGEGNPSTGPTGSGGASDNRVELVLPADFATVADSELLRGSAGIEIAPKQGPDMLKTLDRELGRRFRGFHGLVFRYGSP